MSVLRELVQRDGLLNALNGRDEEGLLPLLRFLVKHICNPRYAALLMGVSEVLLGVSIPFLSFVVNRQRKGTRTDNRSSCHALRTDLYAPGMGQSLAVDEFFKKLADKLRAEAAFQRDLFKLLVGGATSCCILAVGISAINSPLFSSKRAF